MIRAIAHRLTGTLGAALMIGASLAAANGAAAQGQPDAGAFVAKLGTEAIQVLGPSVPPARRDARFRQLFDDDFDLPQIARFVLGPQRNRLAPQEQQEFLALFREFLVQSYTKRLAEYAGEPFRVTGTRPTGEDAVVTSQVAGKSGKSVEIDWRVTDRNGRLAVTDVSVDGVSMKVTQRDEFAGIIQRNGGNPASLLAVLRQQLAQEPATKARLSPATPGPRG